MAATGSVASIIAVLQLTSVVTGVCYDYMVALKDAPKDLKAIISEMRSLESILLRLQDLDAASDEANCESLLGLVKEHDGPLDRCFLELGCLANILRSSLTSPSAGENGLTRASKAMMWLLKQKGINRSLGIIQREKETLNLALTGDTTAVVRAVKAGVESILSAQKHEQHQVLLHSLMVTDPSSYHTAARRKHEPTTGSWFLDGDIFGKWKNGETQFVWIHGIPGCGKSILCSSIIEATATHCANCPGHAMAYFYFDFNNAEKGQFTHFLSSLIAQLCLKLSEIPTAVQTLYDLQSQPGSQPNPEDLLETLRAVAGLHTRTFVIVDALDECAKRSELLDLFTVITRWEGTCVSVLATSRKERDIQLALEDIVSNDISIQTSSVQADIRKFVCSRISDRPKLKRWPDAAKREVETSLVEGADGMFRWVVCQLEALQSCVTPAALRKALSTLPKTLPDTYDRILTSIDEENREIARKALQWLAYSLRPLTLDEVRDALAVKIGIFSIDTDDRLMDPRDILTICSSLVTITDDGHGGGRIRLAHYSVKEYLVSERIRTGPASFFSLSESSANSTIAETCLTYCLCFDGYAGSLKSFYEEYQLSSYAFHAWHAHARGSSGKGLEGLLVSLSIQFYDRLWKGPLARYSGLAMDPHWCKPRPKLYHASRGGFLGAIRVLVGRGEDVNCRGGFSDFPLIVAAKMGHAEVMGLLLEHGAVIDAENQNALRAFGTNLSREAGPTEVVRRNCMEHSLHQHQHGTALHYAAERGRLRAVRVLIDAGANVNAIDTFDYSTAIHRAVANGYEKVVRLLLDHGADPNIKGRFGASLAVAARAGRPNIAKLLIERGADVHSFCESDGYPLIAAAHRGSKEISHLLLDHGADINAAGGRYGNAICAAIYSHEKMTDTTDIISLLLDRGASVNADVAGYRGRPLYLASKRSLLGVMRTFINASADVNTHGGGWATALHATAWDFGNKEAMLLLLDSGADVNTVTESDGTALEAAIAIGDEESIELLLERGADLALTIRECRNLTPLQIAVRCCDFSRSSLRTIVSNAEGDLRSLLRTSTNLDDTAEGGGELDKALMGAALSKRGKGNAMEILLKEVPSLTNGDDKERLERPLVEAARTGSHAVVKLLLDKGVNPDAKDKQSIDRDSTALEVAWKYSFEGSSAEHNAVAMELLERGAQGEWGFSAETKLAWIDLTRWTRGHP